MTSVREGVSSLDYWSAERRSMAWGADVAFKPQLVIKMEEMCCAKFIITRISYFKYLRYFVYFWKRRFLFSFMALHIWHCWLFSKCFTVLQVNMSKLTELLLPCQIYNLYAFELDTTVTAETKSVLSVMVFVGLACGQYLHFLYY